MAREAVMSPGTVSADGSDAYTHCNAMETGLAGDGGSPARHAGQTAAISLKNSEGTSTHSWTEPPS